VLRTDDRKVALALRYFPPGVALGHFREDPVRRSLRQLALHLCRTRGPTAELRGFLSGADLRSAFGFLLAAAESDLPLEGLLAARAWPPWVRPAVWEARRVHGVSLRLLASADPDHRRALGEEAFVG
jgi:hypothetical protein